MKLELDKDIFNLTTTQTLELHNWPIQSVEYLVKKIDDVTTRRQGSQEICELIRNQYTKMISDLCETTQVSYEIEHQCIGKVNAWIHSLSCSCPEHSQKGFLVRLFAAEDRLDLACDTAHCMPANVVRERLEGFLQKDTTHCDLLYRPHYMELVQALLALHEQENSPLVGYRFFFYLKPDMNGELSILEFSMSSEDGSVVLLVQSVSPQWIITQDFEAKKTMHQMGLQSVFEPVLH